MPVGTLAAAAIAAALAIPSAASAADPRPVPPLIADLEALAEISAEDRRAFWREVEARGAPLIDPLPDGRSLVTFVFRAPADREVFLETNLDVLAPETAPLRLDVAPGTDIHHVSIAARNDLRATYHFLVGPERRRTLDPLNSTTHEMVPDQPRSAFSLEDAPEQPWTDTELSASWVERRFYSEAYGQDAVFDIYVPDGYADCDDKAALVGMDVIAYRDALPAARIADYLRRATELPCLMVVAAPDLGAPDRAGGYDTAIRFLADELAPWLERELSADLPPERLIISGLSRRGMVAAHAAFSRPDVFGRVLSLTGTYVWSPEGDAEPEWLTRRFAFEPRRPIRLFVAAGLLETQVSERNGGIYPLAANRHFRDVLEAKGYDYAYREFYGVHSTFNWQDMLIPGLSFLLAPEP
jgi:enterochelin esterase family protein